MKVLKINIVFVIVLLLIFGWGCAHDHSHDDEHSHDTEATVDPAMEEHEDEVGLTKEQMEKINLRLGTFEEKNLRSTLKVNGMLELPPQNKANVSAMIAGKISSIKVKPGQYVKKGSALATIQNPDFINWQQEYLEVKGELMFLEKEYFRQQDLVQKEISPQKQFDKISSERAIALAKIKGLEGRMKMMEIPLPTEFGSEFRTSLIVRSPLNGYIREIKINTGVYIEPQQELFEIVDNHHLHIDFGVFEKDLPKIKKGQIITFNLQSKPKDVMQAKVFAIGKSINEQDRSISIHAEILDEKSALIPGMYVEGRIILDDQKVTALPIEAITVDKGLFYIFVKEEEHEDEVHFKKIPILKGISDFGYVEITSMEELKKDAEVVIDGAYFLMAQSKKREEGAGHHH